MPPRSRQSLQKSLQLIRESRRCDGFSQYSKPGANRFLCAQCSLRINRWRDRSEERGPGCNLAKVRKSLGAIGIIQTENRGLRKQISRATACRMIFVAFDLCRSTFVAFDDQSCGKSSQRHRGGEIGWPSGNEFFRLSDVRRDVFRRLSSTGSNTRKSKRSAHQLQESPASGRIVPLSSILGELAMKYFLEFICLGELFEASPILFSRCAR